MIKIGITGGIGSGKSTVCEVWKSLGAFVINADNLAKQIMTSNEEVRQQIIETFGKKSYQPDGSLNREFLAQEAFSKGRVKELNAIVHPRIPAEIESIIQKAAAEGYEVLVYEAALLLQNLRPENLDYIALVLSDEKKRIERVQKRDQTDKKKIKERIEKQQNFKKSSHLVDIIIKNNGTLEELKEKAQQTYKEIVSACAH